MKKALLLVVSLLFIFIGCENFTTNNDNNEDEIEAVFNLDPRLDQDDNGYFHLELDPTSFQTIHRISGHIYGDGEPLDVVRFYWESSHYWILGDTLGYIVKRGLTDDLQYVNYDTIYVWGFEGESVATVNGASYPISMNNDTWEVNTMAAPVLSMVGDTMTVWTYFWDLNYLYKEYSIGIILENNE